MCYIIYQVVQLQVQCLFVYIFVLVLTGCSLGKHIRISQKMMHVNNVGVIKFISTVVKVDFIQKVPSKNLKITFFFASICSSLCKKAHKGVVRAHSQVPVFGLTRQTCGGWAVVLGMGFSRQSQNKVYSIQRYHRYPYVNNNACKISFTFNKSDYVNRND